MHKKRLPLRPSSDRAKPQGKQACDETGLNDYATNMELGSAPPLFIHPLGRSRWMIDTDSPRFACAAGAFQTLATDSHLKQPSVHQNRGQALVNLTLIRVLWLTPYPWSSTIVRYAAISAELRLASATWPGRSPPRSCPRHPAWIPAKPPVSVLMRILPSASDRSHGSLFSQPAKRPCVPL